MVRNQLVYQSTDSFGRCSMSHCVPRVARVLEQRARVQKGQKGAMGAGGDTGWGAALIHAGGAISPITLPDVKTLLRSFVTTLRIRMPP